MILQTRVRALAVQGRAGRVNEGEKERVLGLCGVVGADSRHTSFLGQVDGAVVLALAGIKQLLELDEELSASQPQSSTTHIIWPVNRSHPGCAALSPTPECG